MGNLGATELILIFLVVLLVFGAKRIPEIARGMGKGLREFKDATSDIKKELTVDPTPQLTRTQPPAHQTQPYQPVAYAPPVAHTPPAPGQQAFPEPQPPAAPAVPPGTPAAAPPSEGQAPQS